MPSDALFQLQALGSATIPIDEEVPCLFLSESNDEDKDVNMAPIAMNTHTNFENCGANRNREVTDQRFLASRHHNPKTTAA